jgi:8-oxo-dGTP pyrophosphatase MutT (NUDIX family)
MYRFDDDLRDLAAARLAAFEPHALAPGSLRSAAVAVTLVPDDDGDACFVLTRRAGRMRNHAGQWALPGGRIDRGESAVDAARRELLEEVGLALGDDSVLGALDDYATRSGFLISPVVVWCSDLSSLRPNPSEVAEVHRIPLDDLDAPNVPRLIAIPESDRPVIQIPVRGSYIHAPTAAVLYQLREVVLHGRATRVAHFEQPVFAWR